MDVPEDERAAARTGGSRSALVVSYPATQDPHPAEPRSVLMNVARRGRHVVSVSQQEIGLVLAIALCCLPGASGLASASKTHASRVGADHWWVPMSPGRCRHPRCLSFKLFFLQLLGRLVQLRPVIADLVDELPGLLSCDAVLAGEV